MRESKKFKIISFTNTTTGSDIENIEKVIMPLQKE